MSHIETLAALSQSVGFEPIRRTETSERQCHIHRVALNLEQIRIFSGWHELTVCPQHDGTCPFDPAGPLDPIDDPTPAAEQGCTNPDHDHTRRGPIVIQVGPSN